jgi:hypothetical protein
MSINKILTKDYIHNFYTTPRYAIGMRGEGGPFDYDIHKSIDFNLLVIENGIDTIVETGTNTGDTAEFLAKLYPKKRIITTEINSDYYNFAKERLKYFTNIEVYNVSSEYLIKNIEYSKNTIFYLDAHWNDYWPLQDEIFSIKNGIIMIDDFFINCHGFGHDQYKGIRLDKNLVKNSGIIEDIYCNNPLANYGIANPQRGLKSGRCFTTKKFNTKTLKKYNIYKKI